MKVFGFGGVQLGYVQLEGVHLRGAPHEGVWLGGVHLRALPHEGVQLGCVQKRLACCFIFCCFHEGRA